MEYIYNTMLSKQCIISSFSKNASIQFASNKEQVKTKKQKNKTIIEDLLLDQQPLQTKAGQWYTAVLEVVGDEALFRMGNHVAHAKAEQIGMPKNLVSLTMGTTWHEISRVRIWKATANPHWPFIKERTLDSRSNFTPHVHEYERDQKTQH